MNRALNADAPVNQSVERAVRLLGFFSPEEPELTLARLEPAEKLDVVGEVRGVGAMLGVELVPDRDAGPVALAARRKGVIVRASGQKIVMSPPLVITDEQADTIVDVLVEELGRL